MSEKITREQLASTSHDIQVSLGKKGVAEFESVPFIGMMVNLALHIRGLPLIEYEKFKLVAAHFFHIPPVTVRQVVMSLAEIEFVKLETEGNTIKKILPQVPFFASIYDKVGEYAEAELSLNEPEQVALQIMLRLSGSPIQRTSVFSLGAEKSVVERNLEIGEQGGYLITRRARTTDILLSPVFFAENPDALADMTAGGGAKRVKRILDLIRKSQGWPLALIEKNMKIGNEPITKEEVNLLKNLAQNGMVKPPSITTPHAGSNYFMFSPTPGAGKLNPANREIYERAMALVASVRQGQLLPSQYRIWSPYAILNKLRRDGFIGSNSEAYNQYHQLALMRVGMLVPTFGDRHQFRLIQTEENMKALALAMEIVQTGSISSMEINSEAQIALQKDQQYIESLIASSKLRENENVPLSEESKEELNNLFIRGIS